MIQGRPFFLLLRHRSYVNCMPWHEGWLSIAGDFSRACHWIPRAVRDCLMRSNRVVKCLFWFWSSSSCVCASRSWNKKKKFNLWCKITWITWPCVKCCERTKYEHYNVNFSWKCFPREQSRLDSHLYTFVPRQELSNFSMFKRKLLE